MTQDPSATPSTPIHRPLRSSGAVHLPGVDEAVPTHYQAPLREQRRLLGKRAVVDLGQLEILQVSGADHRGWLTTTTSQVLDGAQPGDSPALAVLSPQGRVEHLADAAPLPDGSLLLITDPGRRAPLRAYLESMRFAARVELADRDDLRILGALAPADQVLSAQGIELPDPVAVWSEGAPAVAPGGVSYGPDPDDPTPWVLSVFDAAALEAVPWTAESLAGTSSAEALRIASHRARIATEADDRTIPHELDLLRTAVHTQKGCYRGQETVAKVLNLGQPPRRLVMLHLDGSQDVPATIGSRVLFNGKDVGAVTSAEIHADLGPIALAVVKRAVPLDAPLIVRVPLGAGDPADAGEASAPDGDAASGGPADDVPVLDIDAAQEPIVVTRDHGQRPKTARL